MTAAPPRPNAARFSARLALAAALSVGAAAAPAAASNDVAQTIRAAYKFYVGGVRVGKGDVTVQVGPDGYVASTSVKSGGVANWFVKAAMSSSTRGALGALGKVRPATFNVDSVANGERQTFVMAFANGSPDTIEATPPFRKRHYDADVRAQRGALDPLSAITRAVFPGPRTRVCDRTLKVFDGRRRYDIVIERKVDEGESKGFKTVDCAVRFKRVDGFKEKHMARADVPFTVRFRLMPGGVTLPIRAWADTDFGAASLRIRE